MGIFSTDVLIPHLSRASTLFFTAFITEVSSQLSSYSLLTIDRNSFGNFSMNIGIKRVPYCAESIPIIEIGQDSNINGLQNRYTCQNIRTSKPNTSLRQKLQFSQWCTVIKNLFSIEKLLSSKCHMITCSKRDRLHVR